MFQASRRSPWKNRSHWQFGLRGLLFVTLLVAVAAAYVNLLFEARRMETARRAKKAKQVAKSELWYFEQATAEALRSFQDERSRKLAFEKHPRLADLEAAGVFVHCQNGQAALLNFCNRPETDDDDAAFFLDTYSAELASLSTLSLENTQITARTIARLERLCLDELWLNNCERIDDAAESDLAQMTSLRRLILSGTSVSPETTARLRLALPNCKIDVATECPTRGESTESLADHGSNEHDR